MVERRAFGEAENGAVIELFQLSNASGMSVSVINYGATVTSVRAEDRHGEFAEVVLGFSDFSGYQPNVPYFGAVCGRYANRIAGGQFELDGNRYQLEPNDPPHTLHGGGRGFDQQVWTAIDTQSQSVRFEYVSRDGEEGYPGTLTAQVNYRLSDENALWMEYHAEADQATPVNLTNHTYWNLSGAGPDAASVLDHELQLESAAYLAVDDTLIPTGEQVDVEDSPMDFRIRRSIGQRFDEVIGGYDHCYVVNRAQAAELVRAAQLADPTSGRRMEVRTTEPGLQLYTGNFLDGSQATAGYGPHQGVCLECQQFPDAPNQPGFPSTIVRPGGGYRQTTVHHFGVD